MRLFVAIDLPQPLREAISNVIVEFQKTNAQVRWVAPENLHFTLTFLGEIAEAAVPSLQQKLQEIAARPPFTADLDQFGFFGNDRFIHVIWIGPTQGKEEIAALMKACNTTLPIKTETGLPPVPHLTIGRVFGPRGKEALLDAIRAKKSSLGFFGVTEIKLKESKLRPGGAVYRDVAVIPLRKPSQLFYAPDTKKEIE
ncbi:MAG: RNA 2',3'-cyclic phosphodiesterase [Nanoarchaeota archaeon]|nr:RNA 2',3'-cyclic phosphodiesterase [Nanoarchaeota archaeon]